eukprot:INCI6227.3.p1 GENE.INCI6227.3~~INCI6227.3.p1  ORF type:complete len:813 (-),score=136.00 INCI6227.3:919-3357(-)
MPAPTLSRFRAADLTRDSDVFEPDRSRQQQQRQKARRGRGQRTGKSRRGGGGASFKAPRVEDIMAHLRTLDRQRNLPNGSSSSSSSFASPTRVKLPSAQKGSRAGVKDEKSASASWKGCTATTTTRSRSRRRSRRSEKTNNNNSTATTNNNRLPGGRNYSSVRSLPSLRARHVHKADVVVEPMDLVKPESVQAQKQQQQQQQQQRAWPNTQALDEAAVTAMFPRDVEIESNNRSSCRHRMIHKRSFVKDGLKYPPEAARKRAVLRAELRALHLYGHRFSFQNIVECRNRAGTPCLQRLDRQDVTERAIAALDTEVSRLHTGAGTRTSAITLAAASFVVVARYPMKWAAKDLPTEFSAGIIQAVVRGHIARCCVRRIARRHRVADQIEQASLHEVGPHGAIENEHADLTEEPMLNDEVDSTGKLETSIKSEPHESQCADELEQRESNRTHEMEHVVEAESNLGSEQTHTSGQQSEPEQLRGHLEAPRKREDSRALEVSRQLKEPQAVPEPQKLQQCQASIRSPDCDTVRADEPVMVCGSPSVQEGYGSVAEKNEQNADSSVKAETRSGNDTEMQVMTDADILTHAPIDESNGQQLDQPQAKKQVEVTDAVLVGDSAEICAEISREATLQGNERAASEETQIYQQSQLQRPAQEQGSLDLMDRALRDELSMVDGTVETTAQSLKLLFGEEGPPIKENLMRRPPFKFLRDIFLAARDVTGYLDDVDLTDSSGGTQFREKSEREFFLSRVLSHVQSDLQLFQHDFPGIGSDDDQSRGERDFWQPNVQAVLAGKDTHTTRRLLHFFLHCGQTRSCRG